MAQYIDKDALVAEIEKGINGRNDWLLDEYRKGYHDALTMLKKYLSTLKVKEVDLDKELNKYFITNNLIAADIQFEPVTQMKKCAQYFFELGVQLSNKAQKRE